MSWDNGLHPQAVPYFRALVAAAQRHDPGARVTSGFRSRAEQTRLYRRYLAGLAKYPVAPPGSSKHELGIAIDLYSKNDALLRGLGAAWERIGGIWGGERDNIHFEVPIATR